MSREQIRKIGLGIIMFVVGCIPILGAIVGIIMMLTLMNFYSGEDRQDGLIISGGVMFMLSNIVLIITLIF